jgi:hypothetical protein
LTIDVAAEFCTWTEQWQNGSPVLSLGLADTLECSEYRFSRKPSQLSYGPLNGSNRLAIYMLRQSELNRLLDQHFWVDCTFLKQLDYW